MSINPYTPPAGARAFSMDTTADGKLRDALHYAYLLDGKIKIVNEEGVDISTLPGVKLESVNRVDKIDDSTTRASLDDVYVSFDDDNNGQIDIQYVLRMDKTPIAHAAPIGIPFVGKGKYKDIHLAGVDQLNNPTLLQSTTFYSGQARRKDNKANYAQMMTVSTPVSFCGRKDVCDNGDIGKSTALKFLRLDNIEDPTIRFFDSDFVVISDKTTHVIDNPLDAINIQDSFKNGVWGEIIDHKE